MKYYIFILMLVCSININIHSQNKKIIDSLENKIQLAKSDTQKINLSLDIAVEYLDNNIPKALELIRTNFQKSKKINFDAGIGYSYYLFGRVYINGGNLDSSVYYFNLSRDFGLKKNDLLLLSITYNGLGMAYYNKGDLLKALENYLKAEKIFDSSTSLSSKAGVTNNIANIYLHEKQYGKALEYHNKSLKLSTEANDLSRIASSNYNMGLIYRDIDSLDMALKYFYKAYEISKSINMQFGIGHSTSSIGTIFLLKNEYKKALEYFLEAINVKKSMGDVQGEIFIRGNLAKCYNKLEEYSNALTIAKKGIDLAKKNNLRGNMLKLLFEISFSYNKINNFPEAYKYMYEYSLLKDSIYDDTKNKLIVEMQTKFDSEKKQYEIDKLEKEKILDNEIILRKSEENKKQKILIYSFILGFILILIFSIVIYKLFIQKKKANVLLSIKNDEISQQKEEIESQRDEISAQRDLVSKQKDKIEEIHYELKDSINYAKRIQEAVLPVSEEYRSIMGEHFVFFLPKDVVSGDFYWTAKIENTLIVAVADCTGHGVPGAFMSMLGISFLNEIVRNKEVTKASEVLNQLRNEIINALQQKGTVGEQKDGMDISIIAIEKQITSYDLQVSEEESNDINPSSHEHINTSTHKHISTFKAQWAGANNPLYIVTSEKLQVKSNTVILNDSEESKLDKLSTFQLYELKGDKMPISIYERMDDFTNHEIELNKGDIIYLFTDGYADQFGGLKGKKFLYKNFKELLLANSQKSMNEQKVILEETLIDWIGSGEQIDDVTILGIKIEYDDETKIETTGKMFFNTE